jgi:hypothetical protein
VEAAVYSIIFMNKRRCPLIALSVGKTHFPLIPPLNPEKHPHARGEDLSPLALSPSIYQKHPHARGEDSNISCCHVVGYTR